MHKQLILVRKSGQEVPSEVRSKILEQYKSTYGFAVLVDGELKLDHADKAQDLETLKNIEIEYLEYDTLEFYGDTPLTFPAEDAQPYSILEDSDDNTLIACCISGVCPSFVQKDSAFSSAYFAAVKLVAPKFQEIFEMDATESVEDILDNFNEDADAKSKFLDELSGGSPVVLTCFDSDGRILTFTKGAENAKDYPWGFISDCTVFEPKSALASIGKAGKSLLKKSAAALNGGTAKPELVTVTTPNPKKDVKYASIVIEYPNEIKNANKTTKETWCMSWLGIKPEGYKKANTFTITDPVAIDKYVGKGGPIKSFIMENNLTPSGTVSGVHTTTATTKPVNKVEEVDPVIGSAVIKSPVRDAIRDSAEKGQIKFAVDHHSQQMLSNPGSIMETEKKIAPFSKQLGYEHADLVGWPRAAWREIGAKHGYLPLVEAILESNRRIEALEDMLVSSKPEDKPAEEAPAKIKTLKKKAG